MTHTTIITGASEGIGAEVARQLSKPGAQLVLAARRLAALEAVAKQCEAKGAAVLCVATDVAVQA